MQRSALAWIGGPLLLAACAAPAPTATPEGYILELPEAVIAMAAPYQDLNAVRLDPTTGCYVYRHVGPVEITMLPLRTREGRPICTRPPEVAGAPATAAG